LATLKTLADVPVSKVWQGQQAAQMRLQLYAIGRTHAILGDFAKTAKSAVVGAANGDGKLDGLGLYRAQREIEEAWGRTFAEWKQTLNALRRESASIPFGTLAVLHADYFHGHADIAESRRSSLREAGDDPTFVFKPQLQNVMDAADNRIYKDGLKLSGRIWNLDRESLAGLQRELYVGVANGDSAWNIAQRLETYLGAGQDCPRWTSTRLYSLTKKDIASGDRTGLYSGDECAGQGVSYNALRLARTELQAVHALATDEVMAHSPWVEQEQIYLSPAHPQDDVCDEVVNGGEKGDGVYPVGEISLPLHPNCLCGKAAVLMDRDQFVEQLRGWMKGEASWQGMDDYATWIGADRFSLAEINLAVGAALAYVVWLWGGESALNSAVQRSAQLGLGI
jgi:hypothetical protein